MALDPEAFVERTRYLYAHPEELAHEEIQTVDGRLIDRHTAALRGADGGYLGRVWFFRDITDRRKAERALAESEIKFRAILQATNDGIAVVDHETRLFTLGNQALCKMLGYTFEELTALDVGSIYPPEDRPAMERRLGRLKTGEPVVADGVRVRRKDGSEFFADISAASMQLEDRTYVVGAFRDVTERTLIEGALQRERDFSSAVIDGLPGIFFVLDFEGAQRALQ